MDRVAPVAEDLNLDMAGARDEFLQIEAAVAERGFRFGAGLIERGLDAFATFDHAYAAPAAAGRRLDHHGVADLGGGRARRRKVGDASFRAWRDRHTGRPSGGARGGLVAHGADRLALWADEHEARGLHRIGEGGVLREKAVARMNRLRACRGGGVEDGGDVE